MQKKDQLVADLFSLFDGNGLGEVPRFIDVDFEFQRGEVREVLGHHHIGERRQVFFDIRDDDAIAIFL